METKVLFVSKIAGEKVYRKVKHVPRIGDRVDLFYRPSPIVEEIVWFPADRTLECDTEVVILLS